jgi:hypothetical protein
MNIGDTCHRFFALSAHWCGDTARIVLIAESKGNKGWVSIARSADPPESGYLLSERNREPAQILDQSSTSPIHLWSKSKI